MAARKGIWLALTLAITLTVLGLAFLSRRQSQWERHLVARWQQEVADRDPSASAEFVRLLRKQERLAIGPLAGALADKRPEVAGAARESIGNLVADWRKLPARESVPRLTALAAALADRYRELSPRNQQFCRQVAQSLLVWPLEDADFPADDLVAQCERILLPAAPTMLEFPAATPSVGREPPEESLAPIVSPRVATRPKAAPPAEMPTLMVPGSDDPTPIQTPRESAPIEPRQFIRPRVEPIPPPQET